MQPAVLWKKYYIVMINESLLPMIIPYKEHRKRSTFLFRVYGLNSVSDGFCACCAVSE